MYDAIPLEMRLFPQWIVWRYENRDSPKPTKVPYSPNGHYLASVTNAQAWGTFEQAVHALSNEMMQYSGIGFVLTENDPFAFIDLDNTEGDNTALERQLKIYNEFDSYAERSPSGTGLHIIVKGAIPQGRKRSKIEIYSNQRFMTMTGNVYRDEPINDYHNQLNALWAQMGNGNVANAVYSGMAEAKDSDEDVIKMATAAANGEKFLALLNGEWEGYYPSQSEADFALVDIIAFYSDNRGQIQRIFQNSGLGKRDKSKRQDYVNYMLNKCFDRKLPPVDLDGLYNELNAAIANKEQVEFKIVKPEKLDDIYTIPPGLVGEIAQFIYAQSPRPVPEIALVGALGLMAGIVGRAYNVSSTGLNQYILLLAPTGTGKEAIASGVDKLISAVLKTVPSANDYIGPGEIASPQALSKHFSSHPSKSFVSMVGEFGIYLQQMASMNAAPAQIGLRRMLLDLYNKSGEGKVLRPSIYSDKDKNTHSVLAPSLTIMGESTPEKFYEGLHEGMISEGLLPRFTIIEYHGDRKPLNPNHSLVQPSFELVDRLGTVIANSQMLNGQNKAIKVEFTPEAQEYINAFDKHCDLNINTAEREVRRHLWNRAHVKAMKLAALIAVGCNPYTPVIDLNIVTWATNIVVADVRNLLNRFDAGEIGIDNDETKQLAKVAGAIREYVVQPWADVSKYAGEPFSHLHGAKVIPYCFLQRKLASVAVFKKDKRGPTEAIKRALKTLVERGDIQELSRPTMVKEYKTTALAYMIANVKAFGL